MRLFVAVCLDPVLEAEAARRAAALQRADAARAVRWSGVSGMHLTLQFLGETAPEAATEIAAALDAGLPGLAAPCLALDRADAFPNLYHPRVLWIGVRTAGDALSVLHTGVGVALAPCGFPPGGRPFQPHLTVGRVRDGARLGPGLIAALESDRGTGGPPARPQREVVLFRSHVGGGPPRYERLRTWVLQGSR